MGAENALRNTLLRLSTPPHSNAGLGGHALSPSDLMAMKWPCELKDELEARSGNKACRLVRRRLHAAIVREYLEGATSADEES